MEFQSKVNEVKSGCLESPLAVNKTLQLDSKIDLDIGVDGAAGENKSNNEESSSGLNGFTLVNNDLDFQSLQNTIKQGTNNDRRTASSRNFNLIKNSSTNRSMSKNEQ